MQQVECRLGIEGARVAIGQARETQVVSDWARGREWVYTYIEINIEESESARESAREIYRIVT